MVQYMNNGGSGFQQFMAARDAKKPVKGSIFIWVAIALLCGWLISGWLVPGNESKNENQTPNVTTKTDNVADVPAQSLISEKVTAKVQGLRISNIELKNYKADMSFRGAQGANPESGKDKEIENIPDNFTQTQSPGNDTFNMILLSDDNEFLEIGFLGTGTSVPLPGTLWKINRATSGNPIEMSWKSPENVEFRRSISISTNYVISTHDTVVNHGKTPVSVGQYARIVRNAGETPQMMVETGGIARANGEIERESWKSLTKKPHSFHTSDGFVGFTDQYWQTIVRIMTPDGQDQTLRMRQRSDGMFQADNVIETYAIQPGTEYSWTSIIYAGPKNQSDLSAAAHLIPGIEETIDYGWFWFLARPFLWALNALHDLVGNYGVAIIILTIILRMFMWPLTKKSFSSMAAMQKMQPEMQRIQKQYADDKTRMQAEMLNLYKTNKTNPMGGCLPMLLQIPIFFALYKALLISVPMRQAGFLWISDLSVMDPYFVLPIAMGATMWLQQHLQITAANTDSSNPAAQMQKMMKWLPLIFTVMFAWMPAGLVLYWTVSNLFGIGQMWMIKRNNSRNA
ncbi:MAG: membrane protein insertase YidC [Alphaproteobacteria bacterium]|nr:membrane protein insertase YidC [Alphaproteobacteria bacterium]